MRWIALGCAVIGIWIAVTLVAVAAITKDDDACAKAVALYASTHNEYEFFLEDGQTDKANGLRDLETIAWSRMFDACSIEEPVTQIDPPR
jgi:hypothetical protein